MRVIILDIPMGFKEMAEIIHPVLLQGDGQLVLVDAGYVGALPRIEEAVRAQGFEPEQITHIVLTHQDHDHMGSAAAFKKKYPRVMIMASKKEAPYISGEQKSLRLAQAEQLQEVLPPEQKDFGQTFLNLLKRVEPVAVDLTLSDHDSLLCGGCQIIATPGHTPGHISLYLPNERTVIAGDAMALGDGGPVIANPQFTLDIEGAKQSMEKLLSLNADTWICYHGGVFTNASAGGRSFCR